MGKLVRKRPEDETIEDILNKTYWMSQRMVGKNQWDVQDQYGAALALQDGFVVCLGTVTGEKRDFDYDIQEECWVMTRFAVEQNAKQHVEVLALNMHERLDAVAGALPGIKGAMERFVYGRLDQRGAAELINVLEELAGQVTEMQILAAKVANAVFVAAPVRGTEPLVEVGEFGDFVPPVAELTKSR